MYPRVYGEERKGDVDRQPSHFRPHPPVQKANFEVRHENPGSKPPAARPKESPVAQAAGERSSQTRKEYSSAEAPEE